MEITTDILLKGKEWNEAAEKLSSIFTTRHRRNYNLFMLCVAIGIMYDKRIEKFEDLGENTLSVPRNVIQNNDYGKLDLMFQAAILSTSTESISEDRRLELAFGEKNDFNRISFLVQFANFGVTKLIENIGGNTLETMEKLKLFLVTSVEGSNFDVNGIPDEILLEEL